MTAPNEKKAVVIFFGRGFRRSPLNYGFLLTEEAQPEVHYFDQRDLTAGSAPAQDGLAAQVWFAAKPGNRPVVQVAIHAQESGAAKPVRWQPTMARVVSLEANCGRMLTLTGDPIWFTWGGFDRAELQVGDYVRCRLLGSPATGMPAGFAFDVARIDYRDPVEQRRLHDYLRLADSEPHSTAARDGTTCSVTDVPCAIPDAAGSASGKTTLRPRKSQWRDLPWAESDFKLDLRNFALPLPAPRRPVTVSARFRPVLEALLEKQASDPKQRVGTISYERMAELFEHGRLMERKKTADEIEDSLLAREEEIRGNAVKLAHEFVRQLSRWLRRRRIDPLKFVECEPKLQRYRLGGGWSDKPCKGDGAATSRFQFEKQETGYGGDDM